MYVVTIIRVLASHLPYARVRIYLPTYPNLAQMMGERHSGFPKYVDGLKLSSRCRNSDLEKGAGTFAGVVTVSSSFIGSPGSLDTIMVESM